MSLEKLTIKGCEFVKDSSVISGGFFHVSSEHDLIQAIGYLKHTANPWERIFFRGERRLYGSLSPTAYRGLITVSAQAQAHRAINDVLKHFRDSCSIFSKFDEHAHEALLQHYGYKTTWVDLVDNIWVALWFALHQAQSTADGKFLHYDRRQDVTGDDYGYILLVACDQSNKSPLRKGFLKGKNTEVVDLRIAAPSVFLRPHAQHGLLFRPLAIGSQANDGFVRPFDYSGFVRGIVRFKVRDANKWLGTGGFHSVRSLYPPPFFDSGYSILLKQSFDHPKCGSVQHIGA